MANPAPKTKPIRYSHQWVDAMGLDMARVIAAKIRRDPELFQEAVATLRHWKQIKKPAPKALIEWERIFARNSLERILEIFTEDSEEGNRLRQNAPFCGILTDEERLRFLDRYYEEK